MATISAICGHNLGPGLRIQVYSITLDASYVGTTGETVSMATELPNEVFGADVIGHTKGFECRYNRAASGVPSTGTIKVYTESGQAKTVKGQLSQVATATNLASINFYLVAYGK